MRTCGWDVAANRTRSVRKKGKIKINTTHEESQVLAIAGVADVVLIELRGYIDESMVAVAKEVLAGR
jgi:hypothetical protein